MMPSGPPTPVGGTQAVTPATLLRTNSSLLGGQGGSLPPQSGFPSIVSPRSQYGNMNVLGNMSNVSSLLSDRENAGMDANQHFGGANGWIPAGSSSGLPGPGSIQRGGTGIASESDPLSGSGKGLTFNAAPMLFSSPNAPSAVVSSGVIAQMMGSGGAHFPNPNRQVSQEVQNPQELDVQNFQHGKQGQDSSNSLQIPSQHMLGMRGLQRFSAQNNIGLGASQQQQLQSLRSLSSDQNGLQSLTSLRGLTPVKQESQVDQSTQQQLQTLRSMVSVKLKPQSSQQPALQHQHQQQQIASLGSITNVKSEPQHSDQSLFLQQQQILQSRQSAQQMHLQAASLLQQQRFLQKQQQQQQHMIKNLAMQRSQLPQKTMQQLQQQNLTMRPTLKTLACEPGTCASRLTQYMYQQQRRPADNNIKFWREFVSEYFAPQAKKRLCVSLYGNGRQTTGVFPQDVWHCDICNIKPGRGFETTVEVLPRLCKIKYDSGILEELLYVDMPREYHTSSGYIVLDYGKAIQESVFEQLRVVRDGRLRVVFSTDLKICSWEFCARRHEELIPQRLIFSQVSQLGTVAQKFQTSTQNGLSNLSSQELQNTCNMFVASARHLAKAMEVPLVNDLGYTKRYVRCLQISEVVNSMKDLIDYSRETKSGPIASLTNFPRRTACSGGTNQIQQQSEEPARSQNGEGPAQACVQQLTQGNGSVGLTNAHTSPTCSTPTTALSGVVPQNMNSRQDNPLNNKTAPHFGNSMQISAASSNPLPQPSQPNPSSPFSNTALAAPNRSPTSIPSTARSTSANSPANTPPQQSTLSGLVDLEESQSSVQQIIQEIMMSTQVNSGVNVFGVGPVRNEMKLMNTASMQSGNTSLKGANSLFVNGSTSGIGINGVAGVGFNMDPPISGATSGARIVSNNSVPTLNGCISVPSFPQQDTNVNHQQDINSRMLSGLGTVNSFNNLQFDWNASP